MATKEWGRQPALDALRDDGRSIVGTARRLGVSRSHLMNVLHGRTRPRDEVKSGLSRLLNIPVCNLFTPDLIEKSYDPRRAWGFAEVDR